MTPLSKAAATRGTALFLIAVNLIPLAGVLVWNWSLFQIVALYWLENVVIGGINLLKMLVLSTANSQVTSLEVTSLLRGNGHR